MSSIDYHFHIHYIMHTMPILQYQPWALVLLNLPALGLQACIVKDTECGCSSWIDRATSSIEPGIVFVVFDQAHLTIWAVATCLGIAHWVCPPVTTVQGSLTR
jgi:hypothetical protein